VWDEDGKKYLDVLNNYTQLVHGHAHPAIVAAIGQQASLGTGFPAPSRLQAELAERVEKRVQSIELLRFTNSGSEAVMMAVRAARAFTGRDEILKTVGGYHGSWEQVPQWRSRPATGGSPQAVASLVHLVPFNDSDALEHVMGAHGEKIAAMIFEPVRGSGVVQGDAAYFRRARDLADESGCLLIFDEVVTLRLRSGGYQEALGIRPDLTTLGKIIGGGLSAGAFGGRGDIMELFDPRNEGHVDHSGTGNGNPLTMAAGCVSLDLLSGGEIERINELGRLLGELLEAAVITMPVKIAVSQCGSLLQLVDRSTEDDTGHENSRMEVIPELHLAALDEGLYMAPDGRLNISTAMSEETVGEAAERFRRAVNRVAAGNAESVGSTVA
jgi:glutamate-1-semialdehyde 2,1-aminomutase